MNLVSRTFSTLSFLQGLLFVNVLPCLAQNLPTYEQLLQNRSVQAELELSVDQARKLREVRRQIANFVQIELNKHSFGPSVYGNAAAEQQAKIDQAAEEIERTVYEFKSKIYSEVLLDFQLKRLAELQIKYAGPNAIFDRMTREKLEMTDEQFDEFKNKRTELLKSVDAAIERAHQEAVAKGIPKGKVAVLWNAIGQGPRKLDYALDYLTEEQIELVNGLKKSYDEVRQMRSEISNQLIESLTPKQQRIFKKMQGE